MAHKLLPRLKTECGLAQGPAGHWQSDQVNGGNFLEQFAACILTEQGVQLVDTHSVPSVFAQPLLFSQALLDNSHPSFADVLDQWRGLLAVFALAPWYSYNITRETYAITAPVSGAASAVGNVAAGGQHLDCMLHEMLPEPKALWNPLRLIRVSKKLVGAFSPWTLAFAPATPTPVESIPWCDQATGRLFDPIKRFGTPGIPSIDLTLLQQWVRQTTAALNVGALPGVPGALHANLIQRLTEWDQQLANYVVAQMQVAVSGLKAPAANAGLVEQYLRESAPLQPVNGGLGIGAGDNWLRPTWPGAPPTIVLKRQGMSTLSRLHNEAFPFNVDLAALPKGSGDVFFTSSGNPHHVNWAIPYELFLPERLTYVNAAGNSLREDPHGEASNYSLPLTPEFFKYFNLNDVFNYAGAGDGKPRKLLSTVISGPKDARTLRVNLELPLQNGGYFPIEREYSLATKDLANYGEITPGFVLWPNFFSNDWPHNLAGCRTKAEPDEFQVAPLFPGGLTGVYTKKGDPPAAVKPVGDTKIVDNATETPKARQQKDTRIWECKSAPLGFALKYAGNYAGVVLRDSATPPEEFVVGRKWAVNVDFGTANTMISYKDGAGNGPSALPFQARLLVLNESPMSTLLKDDVAPPNEAVPPFKTLCYRREVTLFRDSAPLAGEVITLGFDFLEGTSIDRLVADLKWGDNSAALTEYLRSLMRLIVTEARARGVGEVRVLWTYPLSLAKDPKSAMENFWNAVGKHFTGGGVTVIGGYSADASSPVEMSLSESEGACRELAHYAGSPVQVAGRGLSVVIDIGGGSTDFAFWTGGELMDYLSCKLAANDVLRGDWVNVYPAYLSEIYNLSTGGTIQTDIGVNGNGERNKVEMWINNALSLAKDGRGPFDSRRDWSDHPAIVRLFGSDVHTRSWALSVRTTAYLLFCGMTYFAGLRAREFVSGLGDFDFRIVFTGRGSSLAIWIKNDPQTLLGLFRTFFVSGIQLDMQGKLPEISKLKVQVYGTAFGQHNLPKLKTEVGNGGLQLPVRPAGHVVEDHGLGPVFGEKNWKYPQGGANVDWNARMKIETLASLDVPTSATGSDCYIEDLLSKLKSNRNGLVLDPRIDNLTVDWNAIGTLIQMDRINKQISQPVFPTEVKSLMNEYFEMCMLKP